MIGMCAYLEYRHPIDNDNTGNLCVSPLFIALQAGGEISTIIFFIITVIITIRIK